MNGWICEWMEYIDLEKMGLEKMSTENHILPIWTWSFNRESVK